MVVNSMVTIWWVTKNLRLNSQSFFGTMFVRNPLYKTRTSKSISINNQWPNVVSQILIVILRVKHSTSHCVVNMTIFKLDLVLHRYTASFSAHDSPKLDDHFESIRWETVTFSRTGPSSSLDPTAELRAHTYRNHTDSANKLKSCEIRDMRLTGCTQC